MQAETKIILPPTPFGASLAVTALVLGAGGEFFEVNYDPEGLIFARSYLEPEIWKKRIIEALKKPEKKEEREKGRKKREERQMRIPFIPGAPPGTDGHVLKEKLEIWRGSLKADERENILGALLEFLDKSNFPKGLYQKISPGKDFRIELGGDDVEPPRLVIGEGFYELGKFHGIKDLKPGRPSFGKVELRMRKDYSALLYASLLSFQVAFEDGRRPTYIFMTLSIDPGTVLQSRSLDLLRETFKCTLKFTRKQGFFAIYTDPEAYRLALIYRILGRHAGKLEMFFEDLRRCGIKITSFSKSGRRFFKVSEISIIFSEISTLGRAMKSMGIEEKDIEDIAYALSSLLISSVHLSKLSKNPTPYEALRISLKALARAIMETNLKAALDEIYGIMRRLKVEEVRLSMVGKSTDVERDFMEVEEKEEMKREELFKEEMKRILRLERTLVRMV